MRSTTEIMKNGIWTYAASLPVMIDYTRAENLGNSVFLFGELITILSIPFFLFLGGNILTGEKTDEKGYAREKTDEILHYNGTSDSWFHVGKMTEKKSSIAIAKLADISKICP